MSGCEKLLKELIGELKGAGINRIRYEVGVEGWREILVNDGKEVTNWNLQDKIDLVISLMHYLKIIPYPEEEGEVSKFEYEGISFEYVFWC